MSGYLDSSQYHRDPAEDLEAGHTDGLTEAEARELIRWHRIAARARDEEENAVSYFERATVEKEG